VAVRHSLVAETMSQRAWILKDEKTYTWYDQINLVSRRGCAERKKVGVTLTKG